VVRITAVVFPSLYEPGLGATPVDPRRGAASIMARARGKYDDF